MSTQQPLVSIVIPVYNGARDLAQCLDSLLEQTYRNIEVICVDDGSTDDTPALLSRYAERDNRVRVLQQENAGPGVARNRGIDAAQGEYLYCFDADDWCENTLVEKAVALLERTGTDMAVLPHCEFDERIGRPTPIPWAVRREKFPNEVISWRDNPNWIFESCQNFPWNKMLRMDFVRRNNLRYQEIYLTEDLMFAGPALVLARQIAQLDEALIYHRTGTGLNTMAAKDAHPLDFLDAFLTFRRFLEEQGLYDELKTASTSWAVGGCLYNLHTLNTYEAFQQVYSTLASTGGRDLGLFDLQPDEYPVARYGAFVEKLAHLTAPEYLFTLYQSADQERQKEHCRVVRQEDQLKSTRSALDQERKRRKRAEKKLAKERERLEGTAEYRVGKKLCRLPRKIQKALRGRTPSSNK